jgi:hypothetical protein
VSASKLLKKNGSLYVVALVNQTFSIAITELIAIMRPPQKNLESLKPVVRTQSSQLQYHSPEHFLFLLITKQLIKLMLLKPLQLPKKQKKRELVMKLLLRNQQPKPLPQIDQLLKHKRRFVNK